MAENVVEPGPPSAKRPKLSSPALSVSASDGTGQSRGAQALGLWMPQSLPSSPLSCPNLPPSLWQKPNLRLPSAFLGALLPFPAPFEPIRVSYWALGMFLPPVCLSFFIFLGSVGRQSWSVYCAFDQLQITVCHFRGFHNSYYRAPCEARAFSTISSFCNWN